MIEEDLRAVMRTHDADAPTADSFQPVVRRDRRGWAAVAAVVITAGLVVAVVTVRHAREVAADRQGCPASYQQSEMGSEWVPSDGADDHLVPAATPTRVVVCAYLEDVSAHATSVPLSGARELDGDQSAVVDSLRDAGRLGHAAPCFQSLLSTDGNQYLLRLDYPGGAQWVSAPGDHCAGSTNGTFHSGTNLRHLVDPAYRTGRWPRTHTVGRLGEDQQLVPGDPVSLTVKDDKNTRTVRSGFDALTTMLNAAHTTPSWGGCQPVPQGAAAQFVDLTFHYASGPDVGVTYSPNCRPNVFTERLAITDGAPFRPLIEALLR